MAALPLPAVIAGAFETLRIQSELAANFAPLQDQQNVLAAIQGLGQQMNQRFEQMNQQMNQRFEQVNQRFEQMNQRFDTLENRQINFEIAAMNARLVQADSAAVLQRPVDIRDGGDIPNFPATQQQLYTMNGMSFIPLECSANFLGRGCRCRSCHRHHFACPWHQSPTRCALGH
ncbi:hypothetical protein B0T25DRAFT_60578 [Lasiosphaeria hispida]|uniref:Uncharacterized protein n=1 Tax=Lasiosphaeria hispida TaxID=260671 RepID=A0AAJ0HWT5_9PEZI|nr:hypothetical protein B0T25DRAFT_60578 [Lasiosphaeria hispida]